MNRIILSSCFLFFSVFMFGQTKFIAHKSHSGKMTNFSINSDGNLGWNPSMDKYYNYDSMYKLDSIQNVLLLKNQKLDSILKDSNKTDSVCIKPNKQIQPKKIPQNIPKTEMINPTKEINQMSVKANDKNNDQNILKHWFWICVLVLPFAYFLFQKN